MTKESLSGVAQARVFFQYLYYLTQVIFYIFPVECIS